MSSYSNPTEDSSSNGEDESSIFDNDQDEIKKTFSSKVQKIKNMKRKNKDEPPLNKTKKNKNEKSTLSYKEKITNMIASGNFESEVSNSIAIKQGEDTYMIKIPNNKNCEDYWVLQHYKVQDIDGVPIQDRWKHAECSIKLNTSEKDNISKLMFGVIEPILKKFMSDPKKVMTKIQCKK